MKSIKNIFITIVSIGVIPLSFAAEENINFEFYNKDKDCGRVEITLKVNNKYIVMHKIVDCDQIYRAEINPQDNITLNVFTVDQKNLVYTINAPGKTKYLSWDYTKPVPLYPQTGPYKGLGGRYHPLGKGVTESGLPLNNNVTEIQIVKKPQA